MVTWFSCFTKKHGPSTAKSYEGRKTLGPKEESGNKIRMEELTAGTWSYGFMIHSGIFPGRGKRNRETRAGRCGGIILELTRHHRTPETEEQGLDRKFLNGQC